MGNKIYGGLPLVAGMKTHKEKILPHYDDNGIYITCLEDFLLGKW